MCSINFERLVDNSILAMDDQDTTVTDQNYNIKYRFEEIIKFTENKFISTDGLTLTEVFQALVQMLNSDLELVKKVLFYANIMAKHGMKVAKESQLNRVDVLRALEGKENVFRKQGFIERLSFISGVKLTKRKGERSLDD